MEIWVVCAALKQRIAWLLFPIIRKEFITINGSVAYFITLVWGKKVTKILIGLRTRLWPLVAKGIDVHLFEVMNRGEYIYCGRIELVDKPYTDIQPDEDGMDRKVWMFPIRPVPDNDVEKPNMFVFKDMDDYKAYGKNIDEEYRRMLAGRKKSRNREIKKTVPVIPTTSNGLLIHVVETLQR